MNPALRTAMRAVADARAAAIAVSDTLKEARAQFALDNSTLLEEEAAHKKAVETAEQNARVLVLAEYQATKSARPILGAEIKMTTVYSYDAAKALEWAKKSGTCLIPESIDEKALLKVAAATPLPFVSTRKEPKAYLAAQLNGSAYAEPAAEPATVAAGVEEDPFA